MIEKLKFCNKRNIFMFQSTWSMVFLKVGCGYWTGGYPPPAALEDKLVMIVFLYPPQNENIYFLINKGKFESTIRTINDKL